MGSWQFWLNLATSVIGLGLMGWQIVITKQQVAAIPSTRSARRIAAERQLLKRMYVPVGIMAVLVIGSWVPYWISRANELPVNYILQWGPVSPNGAPIGAVVPIAEIKQLQLIVNGHQLLDYAGSYRMAGVAFHYFGMSDVNDVNTLQTSNLYDITDGPVSIFIPINDAFHSEMAHTLPGGTNYRLLLIPRDHTTSEFSTLQQAALLGVKVLPGGAGPP